MSNIEEIFNQRTCYKFLSKPVDKTLLLEIYNLMKLGPTSANSCPLRIVFVQSQEGKEKLYRCVAPTNVEKVKSAPVTALFAYDLKFYEHMHKLFPHNPEIGKYFASEPVSLDNAQRNSTLQAAYFMVIARAKGLSCGPMSGFNREAINDAFFKDNDYKINFICNLGYADGETPYPRLPRLDFEECCKII